MLDRSAATSLCSAVSGLDPLSFDSTASFEGTFKNKKKMHLLFLSLVAAVDVSVVVVVVVVVFAAAIKPFSTVRR